MLATDNTVYPSWLSDAVELSIEQEGPNIDCIRISYKYIRDQRDLGHGIEWEDGITNRTVSIPVKGELGTTWLVSDWSLYKCCPNSYGRGSADRNFDANTEGSRFQSGISEESHKVADCKVRLQQHVLFGGRFAFGKRWIQLSVAMPFKMQRLSITVCS